MKKSFRKTLGMKSRFPFYVAVILFVLLPAIQTPAGTLTVNGNLAVTTNLTAQSITLGGVAETSWASANALPLQGYKYVIVAEGTNDVHRGNNLLVAYTTATTLSPNSSNRVAVIVPPGSYNLGTAGLTMNTSYVDLIGLVPAHMTSKQVFTNSAGGLSTKTIANVQCAASISGGTVTQTMGDVRIESIILQGYYPTVTSTNTVLQHVSVVSMNYAIEYAGQYVDCIGVGAIFAMATGTFIDCVGGNDAFGGGVYATGTFIDCAGGDSSFGGDIATAGGVFMGCVGGNGSFAGDGAASGVFTACVGGDSTFGGDNGDGGTASGTFIDCVGGAHSFGGDQGNGATLASTAKLQHCKGGSGSFGSFNIASDDFSYNVGGTNTFLMLPQLPTATNGLPSGTVYNSSGFVKIMP